MYRNASLSMPWPRRLCAVRVGVAGWVLEGGLCLHGVSRYGDSMILAERIFSQSATGEVSSCIFSQVGHMRISRGVECKFSQTGQERQRAPRFLCRVGNSYGKHSTPELWTAAATKFPSLRNVAAAARRREGKKNGDCL